MRQQQAEYHVKHASEGWQVFDGNAHSVSLPVRGQIEAVLQAKALARVDGLARIVVHGERDLVISQFIYQRPGRIDA
jgi:hypothetical protein